MHFEGEVELSSPLTAFIVAVVHVALQRLQIMNWSSRRTLILSQNRARPESSNIVDDVEGGKSWRTRPNGRVVELAQISELMSVDPA
jgi:hypothetical protein